MGTTRPRDGRYFPPEEFAGRRQRVRERMSERGFDALLIASPENIYYLTGLDHMGYFAYQMLVLPADGEPVLITRAMERATVRDMVPEIRHVGYSDGAVPASEEVGPDSLGPDPWLVAGGPPMRRPSGATPRPEVAVASTCAVLAEAGLGRGQLGIEERSTFLPYAMAAGIVAGMRDARWSDCSGLVDDLRIVQSPRELELTREAGSLSESMMLAAIAAAGTGVNEREVMAGIYDAMFRRGGTYPGFVPLVRSTRTLVHEHGTWSDAELTASDQLFLEMAGCIRRYHAPMGRLVHVHEAPASAAEMAAICEEAMMAAADAVAPGVAAGDVYAAWHEVLERHGLGAYRRHHCGYSVGIGYPPSWSGSGVPVGLRPGSDLKLREGMVFHLMSWLLRSTRGDAFLSDTIEVTADGCAFLTDLDRGVWIR